MEVSVDYFDQAVTDLKAHARASVRTHRTRCHEQAVQNVMERLQVFRALTPHQDDPSETDLRRHAENIVAAVLALTGRR